MPPATITHPTITHPDVDQEKKLQHPWKVILYNDDVHSMDEVVFQIQKATGASLEKATMIMEEAHRCGRAVAYSGSKENCQKVAAVLRQIRLQVEVDNA
ncbi:MAG: ATP-dependent Clp protease adaptor ClpS [Armatimonadetes bacterium]|nr:ATP-dependent Clp protease adaptor ClpS [Armatimonadota bacterium]